MLTFKDYMGPANSTRMFKYLVGERIVGVLSEGEDKILLLESGVALVFTGDFWKEHQEEAQHRVQRRKRNIEGRLQELREVTAIGWGYDE